MMKMRKVTGAQARQLLHNKFVVILGASVQRGMYKDLVHLLQGDDYLALSQLKTKGELCFEGDTLVEGGRLGPMNNGTAYREVRQFRSDHHLVRFYFLTRIYSPYMQSILEDFHRGPQPDVILVNSLLWDISRYGNDRMQEYRDNLQKFFTQLKSSVSDSCQVVWLLSMPLGEKIRGGFLVPEVQHLGPTLRFDVIEANFDAARLAEANGLDVLDLHYHFRLSLQHRMDDSTHWNQVAHRCISWLLLRHMAEAWGVDLWGRGDPCPPDPLMCVNWGSLDDLGLGGERASPDLQQVGGSREDYGTSSGYSSAELTPQYNLHNSEFQRDEWSQWSPYDTATQPVSASCQQPVDRHGVHSEQEYVADPAGPPTEQSAGLYQALLDLVQIARENKESASSSSPGGQPEDCSGTAVLSTRLDFTSDTVGGWHNPAWLSFYTATERAEGPASTGYSENSVPWQNGMSGDGHHHISQNTGVADRPRQPLRSRQVTLGGGQYVWRRRRLDAQHTARVTPYPYHRPTHNHHHHQYHW